MKKEMLCLLLLCCATAVSAQGRVAGGVVCNGSLPADPFEYVMITPADRSVLDRLAKFVIDFSDYVAAGKSVRHVTGPDAEGNPIGDPVLIRNNDESTMVTAPFAFPGDGTFELQFAEQTAPGSYALIIPAGCIEVDHNVNPELSFYYTIPGMTDYAVVPAEGEVASLSTFTITFNNYMLEVREQDLDVFLLNQSSGQKVLPTYVDVIGGGKKIYIAFDEVTTPGEWQLNVLDGFTRMPGGDSLPELSFRYTVAESSSVGHCTAASGAADVISLQGVRVQNPRRGLYIVNGKKTVLDL